MKVSALKAITRKVQVEIPGEDEGTPNDVVQVFYHPGALTLELWENLERISKDPTSTDIESTKLFLMNPDDPLIIGWSLEEEDGSAHQCNLENLGKLPLQFIGLMTDAIGKDSRPDPTKAGTSAGGSPQTVEPAPAQTGT